MDDFPPHKVFRRVGREVSRIVLGDDYNVKKDVVVEFEADSHLQTTLNPKSIPSAFPY
jgi:hypothetical protein